MNERPDDEREGRDAEEVLLLLEAGAVPSADDADEGGGEGRRLYTELAGLLAAAAPPRPPAPDLRSRLLAAVRGPLRRPVVPFPRRAPAARAPSPAAPRRPLPRRLAAVAAALLVALGGLAGYAGWLHQRLAAETRTVDRLTRELADSRRRAADLGRFQAALERRQVELARQLVLVAAPGIEVCPLAPTGDDPPHPRARGLLYLSPATERWYVRLADLEPPPPGQVYRLWFLTVDGAMDGGALVDAAGAGLSLAGRSLPAPAAMRGAAVTLEPAGAAPPRPAGPMVLFGDEKMTLL